MSQNKMHDLCMGIPVIPRKYIVLGLILGLVVIAWFVFWWPLQVDEAEFYQTAWFMSQGKCIYKDFFQHHHPLAYQLYPSWLTNNTTELTVGTLAVLRLPALIVFGFTLLSLFYLFRQIFETVVAQVAMFLLVTYPLFLFACIFTRPDGLMNLCIILGLCCIFKKGIANVGPMRWLICGLLCGLAFCFLQKALPFIILFAIILAVRVFRKVESWRALFLFSLGVSSVVGIFVLWVNYAFGWDIYYSCCWKFNMSMPTENLLGLKRAEHWLSSMVYAFVPLWGIFGVLFSIKRQISKEFIFFALIGGYGSYLVAPYGYPQYAVFMMLCSAPFAAWMFCFMYVKYGKKIFARIVIVTVLVGSIGIFKAGVFVWNMHNQHWALQKELNQVEPEKKYVLSYYFYLFSQQPDYVWFNWEYTYDVWKQVAPKNKKYMPHSYISLLEQYKPVIINTKFIPQVLSCELENMGYRPLNTKMDFPEKEVWYKVDTLFVDTDKP